MLDSPAKPAIKIIHPRPEHFREIQELCKRVYPFSKPWSIEQLESHRSFFPDGQLIAIEIESNKIVGLAFSLIISWDDYSPNDSWVDFTSAGFFHNHSPKKGKTLYGAEIMVDPEMQGRGVGKLLYTERQKIAKKYRMKRIRAGARLRGYVKFKDKLSPQEYVRAVIQKKIFDPTLSFQLAQGFQVLDVAKNYLLHDPESLGYAAVIEWLNPEVATEKDLKRQNETVAAFLNDEKYVPEHLPRELLRLVRKATHTLGLVIKETEGQRFFHKVERYRQQLKKMRGSTNSAKLKILFSETDKETPTDQLRLAHSFSLQLEIINACETAYRTWRLRQKPIPLGLKRQVKLKFVLTAHPTEARSPIVVEILHRISDLLIEGIHNNFVFNEEELESRIRMLWMMPLGRGIAPTVLDEAEYLCSLIFADKIFDFLVREKPNYNLVLRTWVGGDKDGHPGVDADVMRACLNLSRSHLLRIIDRKLRIIINDIRCLEQKRSQFQSSLTGLLELLRELNSLLRIQTGDGNKVKKWSIRFTKLIKAAPHFLRKHFQVHLLEQILSAFPGLVLPIELRESADEIELSLFDQRAPIRRMLVELGKISGALSLTAYARGLVISHCETEGDIDNAARLILLATKDPTLPIIPLFESRSSLLNARAILQSWLQKKPHMEKAKRHWGGYLEIMLGYSDSAKEIGVLPSRILIQRAMLEIESLLKSRSIKPVFFHGSGGSVARGGGSLKEQVAWWPNSAIERPKLTIQGEMVQRLFSSKEILNSQCSHLSTEALRRRMSKLKPEQSTELAAFASSVELHYRALVGNQQRLDVLLKASPYRYIDVLRIGSRPTRRGTSEVSVSQLRAIPWILCWTQTRSLLTTWWGIGSAWRYLPATSRELLKNEFKRDPFFSSFVKSLGFTLAKVELDVWRQYFSNPDDALFLLEIEKEFRSAVDFVHSMSGEKNLIWYRPWLEESIRLRAPYIHILNALQVQAMKRNDEPLLKETLVGIACGMLTTG